MHGGALGRLEDCGCHQQDQDQEQQDQDQDQDQAQQDQDKDQEHQDQDQEPEQQDQDQDQASNLGTCHTQESCRTLDGMALTRATSPVLWIQQWWDSSGGTQNHVVCGKWRDSTEAYSQFEAG